MIKHTNSVPDEACDRQNVALIEEVTHEPLERQLSKDKSFYNQLSMPNNFPDRCTNSLQCTSV